MSTPSVTDPPLPYLSSTEPMRTVAPRNDWGLSVDEVPVFAEPQRFINLPKQTGVVRSAFREGVVRCDEYGLHFSGQQNTPKQWLSVISGVARVLVFAGYAANSVARVGFGRKNSYSLVFLIAIFGSLLINLVANFINGRFRNNVAFSVKWSAVHTLQLDKKLRFLTLVYDNPTPEGKNYVRHHMTLNRLNAATISSVADTVERWAPLACQDKYAAQERQYINGRNHAVAIALLLVLIAGIVYAVTTGILSP